jgi:hypothetical protein
MWTSNKKNYRVYTADESAFISEYGERLFCSWESLQEQHKAEYKELEAYYSEFTILLSQYYEDLKLYALMFRNVPLYNISNDAMSVLYFVSRKDEIVGYKKLLQKNKSPKAQLAFLYYENEAMFQKLCIKYADVNFQKNRIASEFTIATLKNFKDGKIRKVLSINDLSENVCQYILSKYHPSEYLYISDCYLEEYLNFKYFNNCATYDFVERYYLKIMSTTLRHSDLIQNYLKERLGIAQFKRDKDSISAYITKRDADISALKNKLTELKNTLSILESFPPEQDVLTNNKSPHTLTRSINDCKTEISDTEKKIASINQNLLKACAEQVCFKYLYENQLDVENYLAQYCEKVYNSLWLHDSAKRRDIESKIFHVPSICQLIQDEIKVYHVPAIYKWIVDKKTNEGKVIMRKSFLLDKWCNIIEEERLRLISEEKNSRGKVTNKRRPGTEIDNYNNRNKHQRDFCISFDECKHQYSVNGKILLSVTTLVENCFTQFDAEYFSKKKAIELGISTQEVLDMWERKGKESRDLGTAMHKKIEKFYLNVISEDDETFRLFKMFAAQVKLAPYRTEWAVYDDEHGIAGTIDFVDYQNGKYIIYDWKRSTKVIADGQPIKVNRFGKKAKFPITHINDTTYYHYALQLSLYRYILEKNYGIQISDLRLGIFHPTYDRPYVISLPYLEKEVIAILNHRNDEHTLR